MLRDRAVNLARRALAGLARRIGAAPCDPAARATRLECRAALARAGLAASLVAAAQAAPSLAASLVDVRVGQHPEFTRVVLQTDAPAGYRISRGAGELRVEIEAAASARRVAAKGPLVREVAVEPEGEGALARIGLAGPEVDVREMVLSAPPRIVLDLRPREGAARAEAVPRAQAEPPAPPTAGADEEPEETAEPKPAPGREQPEEPVEPAPVPEREDAEARETAEARESAVKAQQPAPSAEGVEREPAAAQRESGPSAVEKRLEDAEAELERLAGIRKEKRAPREGEPSELGGASGSAAPAEAPEPEAGRAAEAAEGEAAPGAPEAVVPAAEAAPGAPEAVAPGPEASPPEPPAGAESVPSRRRTPPAKLPAPGPLAFLPAPLDDPLVVGGIAAMLVLVGAFVWVRRRGERAAEADALASPFAEAEPFGLEEPAPERARGESVPIVPDAAPGAAFDTAGAVPIAAGVGPLLARAEARESIFDVSEEEAKEEAELTPRVPAFEPPRAAPAMDGAAGLGGEVMRLIEELERRVAHLETRLEEVADAKERLERHVAAQTEELRVQRAAIARTQRVLRAVVKPEDVPSEPAPKSDGPR